LSSRTPSASASAEGFRELCRDPLRTQKRSEDAHI
jgi:hypothetical protein